MPTIYMDNVTVIDCAFISLTGEPQGRSWVVSVDVTAPELNGGEQVVADFSAIKGRIKAFIDGPAGPDHKTIIPPHMIARTEGTQVYATLPNKVQLSCPRDALYVLDYDYVVDGPAGVVFLTGQKLEADLAVYNPGLTFRVSLAERFSRQYDGVFNYTHGLAKSTSYGCQNILHGHSSMVALDILSFKHYCERLPGTSAADQLQLVRDWKQNKLAIEKALNAVLAYASGSYFYCAEHGGLDGDDRDQVAYKSDRGHFALTRPFKYIALTAEPTVENLVAWFSVQLKNLLVPAAFSMIKSIYVSEGLWKGAVEYPNG